MSLIQNNHLIEQLTPNGAYQPLGVGVLPRRRWRGHDFLNSQSTLFPADFLAIYGIAVSQEIARRRLKWEGLNQLLRRPFGGRMLGHVEVKHSAPLMAENDQHKKYFQLCGWHDEEVHGGEFPGM